MSRESTSQNRNHLRSRSTVPEQNLSKIVGSRAARRLLSQFDSLHGLARASVEQLHQEGKLPERSANALKAAFNLAVLLVREVQPDPLVLHNSASAADLLREEFRLQETEHFRVVFLDTQKQVIGNMLLATGSLDELGVAPRDVYRPAVRLNAAAVVLAHNHPSGNPEPSVNDLTFTKRVVASGIDLGIHCVDHLIFGCRTESRTYDYVSLLDRGIIPNAAL